MNETIKVTMTFGAPVGRFTFQPERDDHAADWIRENGRRLGEVLGAVRSANESADDAALAEAVKAALVTEFPDQPFEIEVKGAS